MVSKDLVNSFKRIFKVLIDALAFGLSLVIAYKLRLEHNVSNASIYWFWQVQLPVIIGPVIAIRITSLLIFQVYSRLWRYTEVNELLELVKPILASSVLFAIPRILGFSPKEFIFSIPVGVIIIDSALCLIFLSSIRLFRKFQVQNRIIKKRIKDSQSLSKKRTILIGAGIGAQELARKVELHPELNFEIIGALDDDERKHGTKLANNIKVLGSIKSVHEIASKLNADQVVIAIPSLGAGKLRTIIELCNSTGQDTQIIPGVDQLAEGKVTVEQIRKVSLEDLLRRDPVDLSIPEIANFINRKTILITGAGGSIGSELTKQIIKFCNPKKVYILGRGENSIFQLSQELSNISKIDFKPIICDIRDYNQLYEHIERIAPDVVFHAAAHKHVSLMEDHPKEAFINNVIGTKNLAEISGILKIQTLVNISTDKAVNPISVMGCTKRIAELVVNSCAKRFSGTKYVSVRFGNVIGSRGSVVPVWEYQLKNKLPLTVTAKDAYRFFMTISEAAGLVIKAGAIGNSGELMVLDMGEEINIYELAQDFIKLSGFQLNEVKINIIGLRQGEKLKEELVDYYEGTNKTKYEKIFVISPKQFPQNTIESAYDELFSQVNKLSLNDFKSKLISNTKELNTLEKKVFSEI